MTAVFATSNLTAGYGNLAAIRDIDIAVEAGEVVAVLGPNGAGKTTLLLALCGRLRPMAGTVFWNGQPNSQPIHRRVQEGLSIVLDDRSVISGLTVRNNLRVAGGDTAQACEYFPPLAGLLGRRAGLLSGGEQQMLTVGRALSKAPKALLIDELSQGLAPKVANTVALAIRKAADAGLAALLIEQNLTRALAMSDRFVVINHGHIVMAGASPDFRTDSSPIQKHFFDGQAATEPAGAAAG